MLWRLLVNDTEFLTDLGEGGDALVEMLLLVAGGNLDADAGLALRDHRIVEAGDVDALFLQTGRHLLRKRGVVEHHGADSRFGGLDVEAGGFHLRDEVVGVGVELVLQFVGLAHHFEHLDAGRRDHRRNRVGEQIRA